MHICKRDGVAAAALTRRCCPIGYPILVFIAESYLIVPYAYTYVSFQLCTGLAKA